MTLWTPSPQTGCYPLPRILWCLAWLVPLQIARVLFCTCCLMAYGPRDARKAWQDTE